MLSLLSEPTPPPVFDGIDLAGPGRVLCIGVLCIIVIGAVITLSRRG